MGALPTDEGAPMFRKPLCECPRDADHFLFNKEDEEGERTHEGNSDGDLY